MTTALIDPPTCLIEHTTIVRIAGDNGHASYCALTMHPEGDQIHCAVTWRVGSHSPVQSVFDQASLYIKTVLLPSRKKESIVLFDDPFEVTITGQILHGFEFVMTCSDGVITRQSVDLKTHQALVARVQLAIKLLLKLGD